MGTEQTGDKVAELLAKIFEEMTGNKYKVQRTGFMLTVHPEEQARTEIPQSDSGQSPEKDSEQVTLNGEMPDVESIELREGIAKFRTEKGWYLKAFEDEGQVSEVNTKWLCSTLVSWIQKLPKSISTRSDARNDRAYPATSKRGIYLNNAEMLYIEKLAQEQNIAIIEKEFERKND